MSKLNDYFNEFHSNISLNPTREKKINDTYELWEDNFKTDEELEYKFLDFYLQGSYATKTAIRPQNDNDFDVDTVLLLELADDEKPKDIIKKLADHIKLDETYKDKVTTKDRCVRINYSGDFHIDIVPAKPTEEEHILIPSKKEDDWVETNPVGFIQWCFDRDSDTSSKFRRIVRFVKHWRDYKVGADTAPKSILLTTLIGKNVIGKNSDAESLVLTLEEMVKNLDDILDKDGEPLVENPSLDGENLARDWDKIKFDRFKKKLQTFAIDAREAMDEKNQDTSIELWQGIFGSKKFPSKLSEASDVANDIRNGMVYVSATGMLNKSEGRRIEEHRFYSQALNKDDYRKKFIKSSRKRLIPMCEYALDKQVMLMNKHFPSFTFNCIDIRHRYWVGKLKPTENSPEYTIKIFYRGRLTPKVYILQPAVMQNSPHRYPDGSLCLFYPEDHSYDRQSSIADTIIPWTAEWLFFYERWKETGIWYGKEAPHGFSGRKGVRQIIKFESEEV